MYAAMTGRGCSGFANMARLEAAFVTDCSGVAGIDRSLIAQITRDGWRA
jgi:hypothetical protein